ncbi:MAG: hypothetical protein ACC618_03080 [Patescibacteria group bacterium]
MSKRQRFIVTSLVLSLGFVGTQFLSESYNRFLSIGILGILTIILFAWSLREGLGKNSTLLTLVLPFAFTMGVGIFWFLLPTSIFARIPVVIFYGFGIYALCLTTNIYTVSAIRTIALLRAARGVGFVLTLVTFFLIFDAILSIKSSFLATTFAVSLVSFPLFLQGYWAIPLEKRLTKDVLILSMISSLIMGEIAAGLFFWPVTIVVGSLFYTVAVYVLLGLGQAKLDERLFDQTVREYLLLALAVFIGMFLATSWRG